VLSVANTGAVAATAIYIKRIVSALFIPAAIRTLTGRRFKSVGLTKVRYRQIAVDHRSFTDTTGEWITRRQDRWLLASNPGHGRWIVHRRITYCRDRPQGKPTEDQQ
jgi:hypothetical protein